MSLLQVSVLFSVYNDQDTLALSLDSLLYQTYSDFEVIAINDGSTDNSGKILDEYAKRDQRFKIIHQTNQGLAKSLHNAALQAKGNYFTRIDADDVISPKKIEHLVEFLDNNPEHVLVGAWAWIFDRHLGIVGSVSNQNCHDSLYNSLISGKNPFIHGSVMFRQDAYFAAGGYRLPYKAQDFDLWLRMIKLGKLGMVEHFDYLFCNNASGISYNTFHTKKAIIQLILQLYKEREKQDKEITDLYESVKRIKQETPQIPEKKHRQLVNYRTGIYHLSGRFYLKAFRELLKSIALNKIGCLAFLRIIVSCILRLKLPNPFKNIIRYKKSDVEICVDEEEYIWTKEWLEKMECESMFHIRDLAL